MRETNISQYFFLIGPRNALKIETCREVCAPVPCAKTNFERPNNKQRRMRIFSRLGSHKI